MGNNPACSGCMKNGGADGVVIEAEAEVKPIQDTGLGALPPSVIKEEPVIEKEQAPDPEEPVAEPEPQKVEEPPPKVEEKTEKENQPPPPAQPVAVKKGVAVVFALPNGTQQLLSVENKPLGLLFDKKTPIIVNSAKPGCYGEKLAIKKGWKIQSFNDEDITAVSYNDAVAIMTRHLAPLPAYDGSLRLGVMAQSTCGPEYKKNVMFLCNHNSCRSQMADGWLRHLRGDNSIGVASAGIVGGTAVKEGAIAVMQEVGIDISGFSSDAMADFQPESFDCVISCCGCGSKLDGEKEAWKQRETFDDWNLDDPPAIDPGDLSAYRRVRDECKTKVEELIASLKK
jgi:arsenate reductase